jgi:drug/metabolite transporter (DMT)-like permease
LKLQKSLSYCLLKHANINKMDNQTDGRASRVLIILAFGAIYIIWGSTYLGIKYAIESLPPFLMSGVRFVIAGAILILYTLFVTGERPTRKHWLSATIIGGLLFLCGNGGVVWAEQYIPSGLAALLVSTEPLWIVLLNWVLLGGTRPSMLVVIGLLVGFLGVWLLIGIPTDGATSPGSLKGAVVVLAASLCWAAGSLYSMRAKLPASPILQAGMQMLIGGVLLTSVGMLSGEWGRFDVANVSAVSVGALFYLISFGSIVAFTSYNWLLKVVRPERVATYAYVNPAVAVFLGWAFAGESISTTTIIATAAIIISVMLMTGGKER